MNDFISQPVKLPDKLPLVPLRDVVMFPGTSLPIVSGRSKSKSALDQAWATNRLVVFVTQKNSRLEDPKATDLYQVGTVCLLKRMIKNPEGEYTVSAEGLTRVFIKSYAQAEPYLEVEIEEIPELYEKTEEMEALVRNVKEQFKRFVELGGNPLLDPGSLSSWAANWPIITQNEDPNLLVNSITQAIDFKTIDKQQLLEMVSVIEKLQRISDLLAKEVKILEIQQNLSFKTNERVSKMTREAILREQMRSIEEELGEGEGQNGEIKEFETKIKNSGMPKEVRTKAVKELASLAKMSPYNPEASYKRNYLEWLTDLPWSIKDNAPIDMKRSAEILDEDHYGLNKVKERILEYLAVHKLSGKVRGSILCFVGPPGTGKTSIGKSIARALGRKFGKVSLGGIRDEAEIRGHRRTYVGSMPGRIVQGIKSAGTMNPVFMLDEIDKIGNDYRGDPSAALLEALDPEQNNAFSDHYLEVPFDLSNVMFITTANMLDTIPPALRDRLEIIRYAGYTQNEKFNIAKQFILPKLIPTHGLKVKNVKFTDESIMAVIQNYTREAGVRSLERELSSVIRKIARKVAEGSKLKTFEVTPEEVTKLLGPAKFLPQLKEIEDTVGASTGLAWTEVGGEIMFIEVTLMPGKGQLILTGQLGDVMKESGTAAMSYVRTHWEKLGLPEKFFQKIDVHVHVPEGAVPKDGPSAGVALTTAIISALTKISVKKDVAMTGEITLRGRVLEIGGLKEKVLAAHRAGVKTIIAPFNNEKDLEDIPDYVQKDLEFVFVKHIDEALKISLNGTPTPKSAPKSMRIPLTPPPAFA
ncbi:MAG: endopeptidase La [Candidatus Daviesbacteria bacterium]|nr:endopeptidase La [Candidatus Daviesbacteria bacterium]